MSIKSVCVYCASNRESPEKMRKLAREVGAGLAQRNIGLVYGGASIGMMGQIADAALEAGGVVTGVIPEGLDIGEIKHDGLTKLIVTRNMHERKQKMFELSDAFVALPGGLGTLEETLEVMTWKYLGIHIKPVIVLNYEGYFDHLLAQFEHCARHGLMRNGLEKLWKVCQDTEELFSAISIE